MQFTVVEFQIAQLGITGLGIVNISHLNYCEGLKMAGNTTVH